MFLPPLSIHVLNKGEVVLKWAALAAAVQPPPSRAETEVPQSCNAGQKQVLVMFGDFLPRQLLVAVGRSDVTSWGVCSDPAFLGWFWKCVEVRTQTQLRLCVGRNARDNARSGLSKPGTTPRALEARISMGIFTSLDLILYNAFVPRTLRWGNSSAVRLCKVKLK